MNTNSPQQQATRRMTRAEKAAHSADRLAEISRLHDEAVSTFQAHAARIAELRANGATEAEIWAETNSWYEVQ